MHFNAPNPKQYFLYFIYIYFPGLIQCLMSRLYSWVSDVLCSSNPCRNGGTCYQNGTVFICACPANFVGPVCQGQLKGRPLDTIVIILIVFICLLVPCVLIVVAVLFARRHKVLFDDSTSEHKPLAYMSGAPSWYAMYRKNDHRS